MFLGGGRPTGAEGDAYGIFGCGFNFFYQKVMPTAFLFVSLIIFLPKGCPSGTIKTLAPEGQFLW